MTKPPGRTPTDRRLAAAEAVFRPKPPAPVVEKPALPGVKELVSLRIDQDVLEHFRQGGPGWQERINEALRKAASG